MIDSSKNCTVSGETLLEIAHELTEIVHGRVRVQVPLAPLTTWRIGGPAAVLVEPVGAEDVRKVCMFTQSAGIPLYVLGNGSNVLIDDAGLPGVVLRFHGDTEVAFQEGRLTAPAGMLLPVLARRAAEAGFAGFNFLAGIPGTVGGAVVGNAGTGGVGGPAIKDVVSSVTCCDADTGVIMQLTPPTLRFAHRSSVFHSRASIVLDVDFSPSGLASPETLRDEQHEILHRRRERHPRGHSAGSVFKLSPADEHLGKAPAWYIDHAGLKGLRVGGAIVSPQHANWIINENNATSADVLELMAMVRQAVQEQFHVTLLDEIQYLH